MSYWFEDEHKLPHTRLSIVSYLIAAMAGVLLLGFWKLQVVDSEHYAQLAERNRIRTIPLIAARGRMLDREGRVLVDNYPSFSVLLLRDDMAEVHKKLPQIAEGLQMPLEDLQEQVDSATDLPKYQPIVVKPEASRADIAFIESHRPDLPMLEMMMIYRRRYPPNGFLAHAVGYVGEVSGPQIESSNGRYRPGDVVGKSGLEREYNDTLMGTDGQRRMIVNSVGREVGRLEQTEAIPGKPIQLTIDYDLQLVAEQSLGDRKGAVVALDPRTGEVLALASHPAPDPNLFAIRISQEDWDRLNDDPEHPLLDRATQAQLAPGSVFKIIVATAMLETKAVPESFSVYCNGAAQFYGRTFHCWEKSGHGAVSFQKAIAQSCDIFFYNVGMRLGIDRIAYYATKLGLGQKTGIDLPGEEPGLVPSEQWKQRVLHQKWYPGETISVAVGQGAVTTTPLQLARTIGGIAMGGVLKQPHLLMTSGPVPSVQFPISQDTTQKVTQAMMEVVNPGGTAAGVHLQGIEFCGKTGSAQVISAQGLKKVGEKKQYAENAWFVGFAPRHNPEIVVSVLVQQGEHGASAAAPVARDIIKAYFDKKASRTQQQYTTEQRPAENGGTALQAQVQTAADSDARSKNEVRSADHR